MVNRYKVIIVDDEPIIIKSLKLAIPWNEIDMDVVGEARNGEEALELAKKLRPDMILSDIRMPSLDGISLMKEVSQVLPSTLFIIISGYGEFEYAREAVRQGAFDYLLKPIDHDELHNVILEGRKKLDEEMSSKSEAANLLKSVQALSTLVRERMFSEMIEGVDQPFNTLYWIDDWEIEHPYHMLVVSLDNYSMIAKQWTPDDKRLWFFAITNVLQEFGDHHRCLTAFPFHNGEWVLIFHKLSNDEVVDLGKEIVPMIKRYAKISSSVGISREFMGLNSLNQSYHSAQKALYERFIHGVGQVYIDEDSLMQKNEVEVQYPIAIEKKLIQAIRTLNKELFLSHLDELEKELKASNSTKEIVERIILELVVVIHRQFESLNLIPDVTIESLLEHLKDCVMLKEIIQLLKLDFGQWMDLALEEGKSEDAKYNIQKAIDYISNRYHHDIGVDEVAEYVGLSCSHFCVIFKQETSYTFLEYLTKYRIEKACSILHNMDVKVYQIAPLVGYQDPRYFTQVFKKITGMTPTEYRVETSG